MPSYQRGAGSPACRVKTLLDVLQAREERVGNPEFYFGSGTIGVWYAFFSAL